MSTFFCQTMKLLLNVLPLVTFLMQMSPIEIKTKTATQVVLIRCMSISHLVHVWTDSDENLNMFWKDLNEFHPNLKLTYEKSKEKIIFLDLVIKLTDGKIVTDLYSKPTDSHEIVTYIMIGATQNRLKDQ